MLEMPMIPADKFKGLPREELTRIREFESPIKSTTEVVRTFRYCHPTASHARSLNLGHVRSNFTRQSLALSAPKVGPATFR